MKSSIRNGLDGPVYLGPLGITPGGIVLEPGASVVVDDPPDVLSMKLGPLAQHLHVSQVSDSQISTPPACRTHATRASGSFDADGSIPAPGNPTIAVAHPSTGVYVVSFAAPLPSVDPATVRVVVHAVQASAAVPANATGYLQDASTLRITVQSDGGGPPVDAGCRFAVLDFGVPAATY